MASVAGTFWHRERLNSQEFRAVDCGHANCSTASVSAPWSLLGNGPADGDVYSIHVTNPAHPIDVTAPGAARAEDAASQR